MMNPAAMAIAAITVMLWILWSDTIRARRPTPILYALRIALFLIVSGILILNLVRYPDVFAGNARGDRHRRGRRRARRRGIFRAPAGARRRSENRQLLESGLTEGWTIRYECTIMHSGSVGVGSSPKRI